MTLESKLYGHVFASYLQKERVEQPVIIIVSFAIGNGGVEDLLVNSQVQDP
jgi:hypothetical protein